MNTNTEERLQQLGQLLAESIMQATEAMKEGHTDLAIIGHLQAGHTGTMMVVTLLKELVDNTQPIVMGNERSSN